MPETTNVLKRIPISSLSSLHRIKGDDEIYQGLKDLMNALIYNDKERIVMLGSDIAGVDDAVRSSSKQRYYSGRINMLLLLFELIKYSESELEAREKKEKNGS